MSLKARDLLFIFVGVAGLLAKGHYSGPAAGLVHSYLGNFSVSFAVYFNARLAPWPWPREMLLSAGAALAAVEAFELTNGFGVMSNTYDPFDLIANAAGIALALAVDAVTARRLARGSHA